MRDYFGPKHGFYFGFMYHYTSYLYLISLVSLAQLILLLLPTKGPLENTRWVGQDTYLLPPMALLVTVWGSVMMQFWRRQEKTLNLNWNNRKQGVQNTEGVRASYIRDENTELR